MWIFWFADDPVSSEFFHENGIISCIVLAVVTSGLIGAYFILVYHIRTYFKNQMILEMFRLTLLFAVFCISYGLRTFY